jgi:hypothetical protein
VTHYQYGTDGMFKSANWSLLAASIRSLVRVTVVILCLQLLGGCDGGGDDGARNTLAPQFYRTPRLVGAGSTVSLATIVSFETDQPVTVNYNISDGQTSWQAHSYALAFAEQANRHSPHRDVLLKFKPNTLHRIHVRITNAHGQSTEFPKPLLFQTPSLPADFPQIKVNQTSNSNIQTAIDLITVNNTQADHWSIDGETTGWLIGLDNRETPIWFMPIDAPWHTIEQLKSGNLRLHSRTGNALEVDMLGNKLNAWLSPRESNPEYEAAEAYFEHYGITPQVRLSTDPKHGINQAVGIDHQTTLNQNANRQQPSSQLTNLQLPSGLILDNILVTYLIPPKITASTHTATDSVNHQSDSLQLIDGIPVIESDWWIVMDLPSGFSEQSLKIDRQQGPIAIGYLNDYPVMLVIKDSSLQFTARTTGLENSFSWHYQGAIDANGLSAQGVLTVSNQQGDILTKDFPWQAYRSN